MHNKIDTLGKYGALTDQRSEESTLQPVKDKSDSNRYIIQIGTCVILVIISTICDYNGGVFFFYVL